VLWTVDETNPRVTKCYGRIAASHLSRRILSTTNCRYELGTGHLLAYFPDFRRLRRQGVRLGGHHIAAAALKSTPLRSEKLDLRLTPGAKQSLQRAAAVAKRSVTDFVLKSALASGAETLADRQSFQLDPEQWEAFVAALDAPPKFHPRLALLLRQPSVLEQAQSVDAG
jgi:uncharacterized protein (DUF1778 family)